MNLFLIFFISLSLLFGCKGEPNQLAQSLFIQDIPVDSALWIDVRSINEFNNGHLPNAIHIPYQDIGKRITEVTSSKKQKIKLYCSVGGRSSIAMSTLVEMGYFNVSNEGGYKDILKQQQGKKNKKF